MPDSNIAEETAEQETKHEHSPRKRVRHRKKQLYDNILKQMEFYFSEANLSKDRFLGDIVKNDPWVPIDLFLKFNKIRTLSQDLNDIAKAMKHSTLLDLSEDRTKIRRKIPVQPYNADERTVYVESIPVSANREWLERVFSDYGPVAYISLPFFKNSKTIKGFAFIEFTTPADAQKCLRIFSEMGCKLPTCMPPEELTSVKMFSVDDSLNSNYNKESEKEEYDPPKKKKKSKEKRPAKGLDLKLGLDSDSEKKNDTPSDENKSISSVVTTPTEEKAPLLEAPLLESKDEMTSHDEGPGDPDTPRKKKARKRTKEKNKGALEKTGAPKGVLWGMQILPKSEWKSLRNKYLNLQRQYMKEIKKNWRDQKHAYSSVPAPAAPSFETVIPPSETEDSKTAEKLEKIPDVFVKEILPEPTFDVRLTKRTIRSNIHALHVDVKEGQTDVIIRFDSANAAKDYCSNSSNRTRLLSSAEQAEQWARAEAARASQRPRGRCRLAERAAAAATRPARAASPQPTHTHIRFDE